MLRRELLFKTGGTLSMKVYNNAKYARSIIKGGSSIVTTCFLMGI